jgi:hypothetical protein
MAPLTEAEPGLDPRRDSEELGRDITAMQTELDRLVQVAGLKGDPTLPLVKYLASSLRLQWRLHDQSVRYFYDASDRLDRQYHETIQKTALVLKRGEQALDTKQAGIVEQLAQKIAGTVDQAVRRRLKIVRWKTLAGWGIAVLVIALLPSAYTYTAGLTEGRSEAEQASQIVSSALRGGPEAPLEWASLMQHNDVTVIMKTCRENILKTDEGYAYCNLPVWLETPPPAHPAQN